MVCLGRFINKFVGFVSTWFGEIYNHISLVSSCAVYYIDNMAKKYYEAFVTQYEVEDTINEKKQKAKVDELTLEFERVESRLSRAYRIIPSPLPPSWLSKSEIWKGATE